MSASSKIEWTKAAPKIAGLYLRNNPPAMGIVKQWIVEIDGHLKLVGNEGTLVDVTWGGGRFWWFGPIPDLPFEDES